MYIIGLITNDPGGLVSSVSDLDVHGFLKLGAGTIRGLLSPDLKESLAALQSGIII